MEFCPITNVELDIISLKMSLRAELIVTRSNLRLNSRSNLRSNVMCNQYIDSELHILFISPILVVRKTVVCHYFTHRVQAEDIKIRQLES